jgi:hypothetical protein
MRMQQVKKITELVAHIIGRKLDYNTYAGDLIQVETPSVQDPLELIRYYLNNQHLVTEQLIADLVRDQLNKNDLHADISSIPKSANWSDYIQKLDQVLAAVRYRREHNFSFDQIMPTQQQLHELQHECLELTEQWYGKGNGNISCFYAYFVAMGQEAYITSFKYDQLMTLCAKADVGHGAGVRLMLHQCQTYFTIKPHNYYLIIALPSN